MVRLEVVLTCFLSVLLTANQSDPNERPAWSDISARLQNLRNLLSSERHLGAEQQTAFEALDREMDDQMAAFEAIGRDVDPEMMAERSAARGRRRRDLQVHVQYQDNTAVPESNPPTSSPSGIMRSRRRAVRPSERLQRYQRERLAQNGRATTSETYVTPSNLSPASPVHSGSERGDRQRAKRRKLDDGTYEDESRTFSYGHSGQVDAGQLRMEIITCDGGEYSDPNVPINSYPQNVLQDDSSVYCTKSNRCNILLKHVGGMPFTLTEIVVKAPRSGYDAPIQEGLVFIAMEDESILDRTSQYDVRWSPENHRHERRRRDTYRPSREYMNSTRSPLRSIDRSRYLGDPTGIEDDPYLNTPLVPGFNVTVADPSDEEDIGEDPPSPRTWHDDEYSLRSYIDRYRPIYPGNGRNDGLWSTSSESEVYEPNNPPEERGSAERERFHRHRSDLENTLAHRNRMLDLMRAQSIRENDQFFGRPAQGGDSDREDTHHSVPASGRGGGRNLAPGAGPSDPAHPSDDRSRRLVRSEPSVSKSSSKVVEASPSMPVDPVIPHARFFISRSKSSTAIKFEPPV